MKLFSPAKINLFFKLIAKRGDGYHDLQSLFQTINIGDIISIEKSDIDQYRSNHPLLKWDAHNTVTRAVKIFREETKLDQPVNITHDKKIPIETGLGGGSGNAATILWGLNELLARPLSTKRLQELSLKIGCDVPFFFSNGTAVCEGKGEVVSDLPPLDKKNVWLLKPPYSLSTKEVYSFSRTGGLWLPKTLSFNSLY